MKSKFVEKSSKKGVSLKAILIALTLTPLNVYWIIQLEVVRYTHPTLIHPLSNVIFIIFVLTTLSLFFKKFKNLAPSLSLRQGELLTIYVMLCIVSSLCSADMMEILITILGHPYRFATPENEWKELFWKYLPKWLTVQDETALRNYYEGESSLYFSENFKAWLIPAFWWLSFIFMLLFTMLCLNTILRKQWTEKEKLSYPIIQLALEISHSLNPDRLTARSSFFKNKLTWIGFSIAAVISLINLLNSIYPNIPYIPLKRQRIDQYFTEPPFNAMGAVQVMFYPFAIGVSFLIPLDLLLSCWLFYWFYKMELSFGSLVGLRNLPGYPYGDEQAFGAYIAILSLVLWQGREHLKNVLFHAFSSNRCRKDNKKEFNDSFEPMPYRYALLGIAVAMIFFIIFSSRAGMSLWVIPIFFGIYFWLGAMIARMRAELGFLVHDLHNVDPDGMLSMIVGIRRLGTANLTIFSLYMFFNRAYRSHPMPQQLEGFKLAERVNIDARRLALAMMLAVLVGSIVIFWLLLDNYYRHGAESGYYQIWALGYGRDVYGKLENRLSYPTDTDRLGVSFVGMGLIFSSLLMFLRSHFLWWSFHPIGYAMANSWGMYNLWCCLFVSWLLKWLILRHGGLRSYRRAIPFFLGLALGDLVLGSIWSIASIAAETPLYQFWP